MRRTPSVMLAVSLVLALRLLTLGPTAQLAATSTNTNTSTHSEPPRPPSSSSSSSAPPLAPASSASASLVPDGCSRIRTGRLLLYAAHSGFGNQEMQLRKALLLAYVLNRTLLLPPLLPQSDLSFGPPEQHCTDRAWLDGMQQRAEAAYERRRLGDDGAPYESLARIYDFSSLTRLGMRVHDYAQHMRRKEEAGGAEAARAVLAAAPIAPLTCGKADRLTVPVLRSTLRPLHGSALLRLGSVYFLKLDVQGLRHNDPCFAAVPCAHATRTRYMHTLCAHAAAAAGRHPIPSPQPKPQPQPPTLTRCSMPR